eukprot:CAMPEP_0198730594 /NCGR_PEP_ID=MMETSP1475-20131203/25234_1 /TAXON_ID= ORGANISM="Unidentified sp., Strain CCMP1999" /NCGR_SAMPLE_ID=MMETSP1475 /ASSEMBLY_ACC=CAM_ASM_001111 /LENGTH=81 /DNA_ID=CAMNT_0044493415 /DNA_START=400 /DNA_END=645 /DNA_ORIENTATION=-
MLHTASGSDLTSYVFAYWLRFSSWLTGGAAAACSVAPLAGAAPLGNAPALLHIPGAGLVAQAPFAALPSPASGLMCVPAPQ